MREHHHRRIEVDRNTLSARLEEFLTGSIAKLYREKRLIIMSVAAAEAIDKRHPGGSLLPLEIGRSAHRKVIGKFERIVDARLAAVGHKPVFHTLERQKNVVGVGEEVMLPHLIDIIFFTYRNRMNRKLIGVQPFLI